MKLALHPANNVTTTTIDAQIPAHTNPLTATLDELAATVDRFGIGGVLPAQLDWLAGRARAAAVHPQVAALLTDTRAPEVVRRRAFDHVCRRVSAMPGPVGTTE